jgi:hypothetical protein
MEFAGAWDRGPGRYSGFTTTEADHERPEICEFADSGKYLAYDRGFRGGQRVAANLDYWDGEP